MFETTIAGSLPKPAWLAEPNKLWPQWRLAGAELAAAQARRDAARAQGAGGRRHRHRQRRRAVAPALRARLPRIVDGIDFAHKVEMGIRNDRYKAMVPTVVGALRLKGRVHATEARLARAHTQAQAQVHAAGADDHRRHHRRPPLRRPREDGDGVRRRCSTRRRARCEADGVDVIQFDEPAFNVYMDEVADWGIEALHRAIDGLDLHDRRAHLLRLRHQGQHRLEGDARRRVAAVRGDLSRRWRRAASTRSRSSAATRSVPLSLLALLEGKDVLVGVIDVASDDDRDAGGGRRDDRRGDEVRAEGAASSPAPIAAWRRCGATSPTPSCRALGDGRRAGARDVRLTPVSGPPQYRPCPRPISAKSTSMLRAQVRRFVETEIKPHGARTGRSRASCRARCCAAWASSASSASAIRPNTAAPRWTRSARSCSPRSSAARPSAASRSRCWCIPTWPRCTSPTPARRRRRRAGCRRSSPARAISAVAVTEPDAGSDVKGIRTTARRDGDALRAQRRQDVHHQRRARRPLLRRRQDRAGRAALAVGLDVPGREGHAGLLASPRARQARLALVRHRRACRSRIAACRPRTCSARKAAASTPS